MDNRFATASHIITVAVPTAHSLDTVDAFFRRHLARDDVRLSDVTMFAADCEQYPDGREYAGALANYVIGVLAKDQRGGVTLEFAKFVEKFHQALVVLHEFGRPVARTVTACIRLGLNDFHPRHLPSGVLALDTCIELLTRLASNLPVEPLAIAEQSGSYQRACPVDRDTDELLAASKLLLTGHTSAEVLSVLLPLNARSGTTQYDLSKVAALTVLAGLRDGGLSQNDVVLRTLANDPVFGSWARTYLPGDRKGE